MIDQFQFDRDKMRAVVLHVCHSCDASDVGAVKLHKVLYFFDMLHYAQQGRPVTGATYRKRPMGPTSDQLLFVLRDMERMGELKSSKVDYFGYIKHEYEAVVPDRSSIFSEAELGLLDDIIDFVCRKNSAKTISDYSHKLPWEMADNGGIIPYRSAMLLFPQEPSPEALDLVGREITAIEAERSKTDAMDLPLLSTFRQGILAAAGQS